MEVVSPEWGTSARWKAHTVGPPCPQVPYPRLVEFTDAEPADTEGRLYAIVLCKGLELQKVWCPQVGGRGVCPGTSHLQIKRASCLKEQESFLEADIILTRSRLGNVGWKRPGRSLEVL